MKLNIFPFLANKFICQYGIKIFLGLFCVGYQWQEQTLSVSVFHLGPTLPVGKPPLIWRPGPVHTSFNCCTHFMIATIFFNNTFVHTFQISSNHDLKSLVFQVFKVESPLP